MPQSVKLLNVDNVGRLYDYFNFLLLKYPWISEFCWIGTNRDTTHVATREEFHKAFMFKVDLAMDVYSILSEKTFIGKKIDLMNDENYAALSKIPVIDEILREFDIDSADIIFTHGRVVLGLWFEDFKVLLLKPIHLQWNTFGVLVLDWILQNLEKYSMYVKSLASRYNEVPFENLVEKVYGLADPNNNLNLKKIKSILKKNILSKVKALDREAKKLLGKAMERLMKNLRNLDNEIYNLFDMLKKLIDSGFDVLMRKDGLYILFPAKFDPQLVINVDGRLFKIPDYIRFKWIMDVMLGFRIASSRTLLIDNVAIFKDGKKLNIVLPHYIPSSGICLGNISIKREYEFVPTIEEFEKLTVEPVRRGLMTINLSSVYDCSLTEEIRVAYSNGDLIEVGDSERIWSSRTRRREDIIWES